MFGQGVITNSVIEMNKTIKLITLQGVSTSGKTTLATELAKHLDGEYICPYWEAYWTPVEDLAEYPFLSWKIRNALSYANAFHSAKKEYLDKGQWVVFDEGFKEIPLQTYFGLHELSEAHNFALFISHEEYVRRKKIRDDVLEASEKHYRELTTVYRQNVLHGVIELDGHLPVSENIQIIMGHLNETD